MTDRIEFKAAFAVDDAGEITGTAWPFGSPDRVGDVITKGAFTAPASLPMLFAHDQAQVIGVWNEITETPDGLTVKGRLLVDDVARAAEVRAMIQAGAVSGLSIGFVTKSATPRPRGRTITALDLHEISVVAIPSHPGAQITSIKAANAANTPEENTMLDETQTPANAQQIDTKAFDAMKARLDQLEAKSNRPRGNNASVIYGADDQTEKKAFAGFLRTGDATEVKALSVGAPSTGGILAPETVASTILEKVAEFSPVRTLAQTLAMSGPLLQLPRLVNEITVGDVTEISTRPESEPTFEQIDLKPHEMAVILPITKTLLEDAQIDLSAYLSNHVARRFGQKEAAWFVNGNGTSQAEGVLNSTEVQNTQIANIAALTSNALIDLFYSVKSVYAANGAWLMNRATMARIRKLQDTQGSYLWQSGIAAGQPPTLLGRPVYESVDMPNAVAAASPIIFGDFASGYVVADRIGFEIVRDDLTGAANGLVKLVARRRVGGRVIMGEALSKLSLAA
ncbi:MAG: phage major capsid protein family [Cypionkella sp.]|uniref:phage major capsid protein n=1 Tax=Cypionkella sp. TaxID=2811411 RepID=UPI00262DF1C7|nr:phage major capsid protein [Cypionkella sp.]MDB5659566.1 phage major capsid protein family [Cypionkella sp.]